MGRLHLAVTVSEGTGKVAEPSSDTKISDADLNTTSCTDDAFQDDSLSIKLSEKSQKVADKFELIDIEEKSETGIWIHHPGSEVAQVWEPRKGKTRRQNSRHRLDGQIQGEICDSSRSLKSNGDGDSTDESVDSNKSPSKVRKGLRKISSVFRRRHEDKLDKSSALGEFEPSPRDNIRASNAKEVGVRWITDDTIVPHSPRMLKDGEDEENTPHGHVKDVAKSILKQAGKLARS